MIEIDEQLEKDMIIDRLKTNILYKCKLGLANPFSIGSEKNQDVSSNKSWFY